jgi:uncharacterized repeat protein (TIGR01451 family)
MNPRMKSLATLGCLAACAWSTSLSAATFTVTTPAEFQAALTAAAGNGQNNTIEVAAGTYNLTATLTFVASAASGQQLVISGADPATTILDGQNNVQIMSIDLTDEQNVLQQVQVQRLTFRNGSAQAAGDTGGGLEMRSYGGARWLVRENRFLNNRSQDDGGGLYVRGARLAFVRDTVFQGNRTELPGSDGGGAFLAAGIADNVEVLHCEFIDNSAPDNGGGLQVEGLDPGDLSPNVGRVDILESLFVRNSTIQVASGEGGGADLAANQIWFQRNQLYDNSGSAGGGIYLRGFTYLRLEASVFMGNRAAVGDGGGIGTAVIPVADVEMVNNTLVANTAVPGTGAGAYMRIAGSTSSLVAYNNIVWGNSAGAAQGADLYIDNNPFNDIGARVQLVANNAGSVFIKCDTPACSVTRTGNLNVVPGLVDAVGPDFDPHLQSGSPMIDQGSSGITLSEIDFEGDGRVSGVAVDIGADEFTGQGPPPPLSADVAITMTDSPDPVVTGGRLTYSITVTNAGPDAAAAVTLADKLPAGVSFVSTTPSQGSCSQSAGTVTCNLGGLASGGSATVALAVDVTAEGGTTLSNTATVGTATADPNAANNSVTATTQVSALRADRSVSVGVTPAAPQVRETVTYTVTVANAGPDNETAATLDLTLPAAAEVLSVTPAQGTCNPTSGGRNCVLGALAAGAQTTVTVTLRPTAAGTLVFGATVDGNLADANGANNSVTATTQVSALRADRSVSAGVTPAAPQVGETMTYTVTVANAGPGNETAATLDLALPAAAEVLSVTPGQGTCNPTSGGRNCVLGALAAGAQTTVTVTLRPTAAGTLVFGATVGGNLADANGANDSAQRQVTVTDKVAIVVKGKAGKGSFGWLQLLGLAVLFAARRERPARAARSAVAAVAVLAVAVVALVLPAPAGAADSGWYVGASAGAASADYGASDLTADLAGRGWTVSGASVDDSDTFWKAYVGYRANEFFALEAGYAELGEIEARYGALVSPDQIPALLSDTVEVLQYLGSGWNVSAVLSWSFAEDAFAIFGRAGLLMWDADVDVKVESGATGTASADESGTDAMFGLGVEWRATPAFSLRAEWERYKLDDWVDVPSAGVVWRFR